MKRGLLILMFGLILVAAWFRWFDEMDPEMVKAEVNTQAVVIKDKMADFSFKREMSEIVSALDHFFSPAHEVYDDIVLLDNHSTEVFPEVVTETNEPVLATEEVVAFATEEEVFESTIIPVQESETEVPPVQEGGSTEVVASDTAGYPAPVMVPVTIVEPTEEVGEAMEVQTQEVVEVESNTASTTMAFNQLQESVPGSFLPYNLQSVEPLYTTNFVHPELGCDWMGVAGQIFDENQEPMDGMVVVVEGVTNNSMIELLGYSGLAQEYGPGGYELVLNNVNGPGIFWIQLFGEDGKPLSDIYSFQMNGTCEQNLAVINFSVTTEVQSKFVPTVSP